MPFPVRAFSEIQSRFYRTDSTMRSFTVQTYNPSDPPILQVYSWSTWLTDLQDNILGTRFVAHMPKCDYDHATMTGAVKLVRLSGWDGGVLVGVAFWPLTFSGWQTKGRCVWGARLPSASSPPHKTAPTGEWYRARGKVKRSAAFSHSVQFQEIRQTCVLVSASMKRA